MDNTDKTPLETAKNALELIEEIERNYAQQAMKMQDTEIAAVLEAIRMFHANSGKKLKDYLNNVTGS
ncbi:MAG: hypothetical protein E4H15_07055 [Syntrophobacterales bacterium]|nr:MAG: hypothetical protein E4H15_07055 [Syntrophobacterales bacterium]